MLKSDKVCPYFNRLGSEMHYPISGYCERSSMCALRVPSSGEFQRFCSTGDYRHCPIYRMGTKVEPSRDSKPGSDKLEMS